MATLPPKRRSGREGQEGVARAAPPRRTEARLPDIGELFTAGLAEAPASANAPLVPQTGLGLRQGLSLSSTLRVSAATWCGIAEELWGRSRAEQSRAGRAADEPGIGIGMNGAVSARCSRCSARKSKPAHSVANP